MSELLSFIEPARIIKSCEDCRYYYYDDIYDEQCEKVDCYSLKQPGIMIDGYAIRHKIALENKFSITESCPAWQEQQKENK